MRELTKPRGTIQQCHRNDGSGVCFGASATGCKNWHGQITSLGGKVLYFRCDHGASNESPTERAQREEREKAEKKT